MKLQNLVAASSVLELARLEPGTTAEEVVDLASLDVVRQAGDEECVDRPGFVGELREELWKRVVDVVRIVRLVIRRHFSPAGGKVGGGNNKRRRREMTCK